MMSLESLVNNAIKLKTKKLDGEATEEQKLLELLEFAFARKLEKQQFQSCDKKKNTFSAMIEPCLLRNISNALLKKWQQQHSLIILDASRAMREDFVGKWFCIGIFIEFKASNNKIV